MSTESSFAETAAVLTSAPGAVEIVQVDLDGNLEPGEVRVKVAASGLCHSDLHMLEGTIPTTLPMLPGHEVAGVVEAIGGGVTEFEVGDHVVACLSMFCGHCGECQEGCTWLCLNGPSMMHPQRSRPRVILNGEKVTQGAGLGGLIGRTIVPENALVKVPEELPFEQAALLGCAVVTGVGGAINGARVRAGATVAVFGCGGVGLNVVQGCRLAGAARIIAVDRSPDALAMAVTFGATDTVLAAEADVVAAVRELVPGGVDDAFDVVGVTATMRQAISVLRPGRTAYLIGVPAAGATIDLPGMPLLFEAKGVKALLMGSNRFRRDIPMLADLALQGKIDVASLIAEVLPLEQVNDGFDRMRRAAGGRVVIRFD